MIHSFFLFESESHFCSQKKSNSLKQICCFHHVFDSFSLLFPFLCPRANCSRSSLLRGSLKKSDMSDWLLEKSESLFRSFAQKNEQFAQKPRANSQPWVYYKKSQVVNCVITTWSNFFSDSDFRKSTGLISQLRLSSVYRSFFHQLINFKKQRPSRLLKYRYNCLRGRRFPTPPTCKKGIFFALVCTHSMVLPPVHLPI